MNIESDSPSDVHVLGRHRDHDPLVAGACIRVAVLIEILDRERIDEPIRRVIIAGRHATSDLDMTIRIVRIEDAHGDAWIATDVGTSAAPSSC